MRVSFSTTESAYFDLRHRLMLEFRRRHVRLVHLHEVDAHEEGLRRAAVAIEIIDRRPLDVLVVERNADHALFAVDHRRIDVLAVDLEFLFRRLPGIARHRALRDLLEQLTKVRGHVREPGRIGIGVRVEMIEAGILHLVVALRIGERVVGFAEVPFASEERLVATGLEHGRQVSIPPPAGRRPGPGRPRWSCRCGSGCGRSAPRHGPACSSAVRRRIERSCPQMRDGRAPAWACRGSRLRHRDLSHRSRNRRTG